MEKFITPFIELIKYVIDRSGTKALVALGTVGGLFYLTYAGKLEGLHGAIGMVLVSVLYFAFRKSQEVSDVCDGDDDEEDTNATD